MQRHRRSIGRLAAWLVAWLVPLGLAALDATPAGAQLGATGQRCVDAMNGALARVQQAGLAQISGCVRRNGAGRPLAAQDPAIDTVEECVVDDPAGALARAEQAAARQFASRCAAQPPSFGTTDAATVAAAGRETGVALIHDALGDDLDGGVLVTKAVDAAAAACQQKVWQALAVCARARSDAYRRCARDAVRGKPPGAVASAAELRDRCLGVGAGGQPDAAGRIEARCGAGPRAIAHQVAAVCGGEDLATLFPGCGTADGAATSACLERSAACRACRAIDRAAGLDRNCDAFDNGVDDGSCGCGDGVLTPAELCDDGNEQDGDGCSSLCQVEDLPTPTPAPSPTPTAPPAAECPCWDEGDIDAAFPPGFFDTAALGGAVCDVPDGVRGVGSADTCEIPTPAGGTTHVNRAGAFVLPTLCVPILADLDPANTGICSPPTLVPITPGEHTRCIQLLEASQTWQAECE